MLYITSSGTGGHAQVAIYTDNGNKPGTLLAKSSSDTITSSGWHDFSGFNVPITGGTKYWLACESDTYKLAWHYNNGGANYYQGTAGSYGTFPNPYTGNYGGSYTTSIYATYTTSGNTPTPTPTPTPNTNTSNTTPNRKHSNLWNNNNRQLSHNI